MKQVVYPKYAGWIIVYALLFFTFGVSIGELLNNMMPKYDDTKHKFETFLEIVVQISLIVLSTYVFREYINFFLKNKLNIYKKPDKFAVLIIAPTMFSQQTELIKKIHHVWDF